MPYNGSGSFSPPGANYPAVSETVITAANRNAVDADFATGLTTALTKDGQSTPTANIPLGGYKLTGVGAATARTDAATLASIQDGKGTYVATVGGTVDVITLTASPAITAYAAGQTFRFIASGTNTTAVTVNVSGLGAKALTKNGTTALSAADILSGTILEMTYDGTRFITNSVVDGTFVSSFTAGTTGFTPSTTTTGAVTLAGTLAVTNGGTGVTTSTGTGATVLSISPSLTTPALGTPASGVATNLTGTAASLTAGNVTTNANLTGHVTSVGNAAVLGAFTSAQLSAALSDETGSGLAVFSTSPSLTTPALGTPSSGTLTNCTGTAAGLTAGNVTTNANLTGHVTSVGNAAVLGSFTSAQLATALTDETGSGLAVFATSPSLTSPALGTPSALIGTNITGTATAFTASNVTTNANLTGHVTSVGNAAVLGSFTSAQLATALTDETGSGLAVFATSPQFTTPLLGVPTSGTLTNCTGLPVAGGGTGSATAAAAKIALAVVSSATGSEIIPAGTTAERDVAPATGYLRFNTSNVAFEGYTGAAWSSIGGGGAALSNDTATATDIYPLFAAATTGTPTNIYTSNAKLLYKPSTGEFKATVPVALNGLVVNATAIATSYTIGTGYNASSVGPVTIGGGVVITISSGQRWLVL